MLTFENCQELEQILVQAQDNTYDLSDLLIAYHCQTKGYFPVMTFDKKATKFTGFQLIS